MSTLLSTKTRRSWQRLWSQLNDHLFPFISEGIILAISGGPDSRALLEAIALWPKRTLGKWVVVVVNHGQRIEADQESLYVLRRAKRLGFEAHYEMLPIFNKMNEQDLRKIRYEAIHRVAKIYNLKSICLAHHRDDNSEGFFMALMGVGGGEVGASMTEVEMVDGFRLLRPFLSLTKADLLLSLSMSGQTDFVIDRLDEEKKGARAYVRHEVFPPLMRKTTGFKKRLAHFGLIQKRNQAIIDKMARSLIVWQENGAFLKADQVFDEVVLSSAVRQVIKKLNPGKDLRQCLPQITKLVKDAIPREELLIETPGLDPKSNAFNLRDLSRKEYQFPGVLVTRDAKSAITMRFERLSG
jgi:tRNA(Ile)-lysidine synthetase-like protein